MGKFSVLAVLLIVLAACQPDQPQQPLPTLAQLPTSAAATPTTESEGSGSGPTPEPSIGTGISVQFVGAVQGTFTQAALTFEMGGHYTLLLEQADDTQNPVQLRILLAPNIEPGTYPIVPDDDFQLPAGQTVAARFDLGFVPEDISGTFVLESTGENNYSGSVDLTAVSADGKVTVTGRFDGLNAAVIG